MKLNSIIISLILILITSCSGKQIVSGNLPDIERLTLLELGKDNKESVKNLLGTPSFEGTLGDNSYYYVGTLSSKFAFKKKTQKQYIINLHSTRKMDYLIFFFMTSQNQLKCQCRIQKLQYTA